MKGPYSYFIAEHFYPSHSPKNVGYEVKADDPESAVRIHVLRRDLPLDRGRTFYVNRMGDIVVHEITIRAVVRHETKIVRTCTIGDATEK